MAKKIKESKPFSLRMNVETLDRLNQYCEDSGQSKTTAVERAINAYIDDYYSKMQKLKEKENQ